VFGSNKIYSSMLNSFYYDWTLTEAAKTAAQPHCCLVPKMKVLQPHQNFCKQAFPKRCKNESGWNKLYLSMFNSFYYDWTLTEAAKNAAQAHCCLVTKMKVLQPPQNSCKQAFPHWHRNEFGWSKTYLSMFTGFIVTEHWLKQPKLLPSHIVV